MISYPPIDAVITWVDGDDPSHAAKRFAAMEECGLSSRNRSSATTESRFINHGEIYYCIASIIKYIPFIRNIYIITDNQIPKYLLDFVYQGICQSEKIQIVDHRVIFRGYEEYLPTFNSLSIEAMMWNIPSLSEFFLYFNDDFFVNSDMKLSHLFSNDNKINLYGNRKFVFKELLNNYYLPKIVHKLTGKNSPSWKFKTAQPLSAKIAGLWHYVTIDHSPHLIRTATLADYYQKRPEELRNQIRHKFRSFDQILPTSLANHLEIVDGNADILEANPMLVLKPEKPNWDNNIYEGILKETTRYGCIQNLNEFSQSRQKAIRAIMRQKFEGFLPT